MKVKVIDPGVYRFEPDADDVPAWNLSKEQLIAEGWSTSLVDLIAPYLRNGIAKGSELEASIATVVKK
jgi:hypothetical protein